MKQFVSGDRVPAGGEARRPPVPPDAARSLRDASSNSDHELATEVK